MILSLSTQRHETLIPWAADCKGISIIWANLPNQTISNREYITSIPQACLNKQRNFSHFWIVKHLIHNPASLDCPFFLSARLHWWKTILNSYTFVDISIRLKSAMIALFACLFVAAAADVSYFLVCFGLTSVSSQYLGRIDCCKGWGQNKRILFAVMFVGKKLCLQTGKIGDWKDAFLEKVSVCWTCVNDVFWEH